MNLYEIILKHFAPKGSERGIFTYLLAESDEEVYEWLKADPSLSDGRWVCTPYADNEADDETYAIYNKDYEIIGHEKYKDRMIRLKGELNDEVELTDLYYGITLVGWRLVKSNIPTEQIELLKDSGVSIESA
ncbi:MULTISPECIES: hypothetical protein [Bacillus]|uniref:hypothetical protein n=1 Tax=Bacillus TaxID=1386 RepID=UPI000CA20878|nr:MULTISPECIES: hypothetical protein [Bacillus]ATX84233.1 hypothetical protein CU084_11370 [Bacillus velezensis]MBT9285868.1 hypothetical protein [Bacillus velezensis]MBW7976808.1 hypothetical protein [Bacillus velezensis]MCW8785880.1 hypothetical protein [Bacillus velezensis]MCX2820218.1 hypothetical protein [Bacillus sp. H1F1]